MEPQIDTDEHSFWLILTRFLPRNLCLSVFIRGFKVQDPKSL